MSLLAGRRGLLLVFALALAVRVGFWLAADQPLLYTHQYHYFTNGLRVLEHADPLRYLWTSDEWRTWDRHWTIAPLYYPFEALVFAVFGPHLAALQLVQCAMGAACAVFVAIAGRAAFGQPGTWAGVLYALNGYSIELPSWTLTENLHNFLFTAALALTVRSATRGPRTSFLAGLVLGFSALARSVSSAFVPVVMVWRFFAGGDRRTRLVSALLVSVGGACMVTPWTLRNVLVIGDPVPIETTAYENMWYANHFADRDRYQRQAQAIENARTPAEKRELAWRFGTRGIAREPERFVQKANANFWHFFRPEGLHALLTLESSQPAWKDALYVVLEDGYLLLLLPLLGAYLLARRDATWSLLGLWIAYYVFFETVVFLNETPRHRAGFIPALALGAVGGLLAVRERLARVGLLLGGLFSAALVAPYAAPAWRAVSSWIALRPALAAVAAGRFAEAEAAFRSAAERAPRSARPWLAYGSALHHAGQTEAALLAYREAERRTAPTNWVTVAALPRLLAETGRASELEAALREAGTTAWEDPWILQEDAWRVLPAPRTDEIVLGGNDLGAIRGFFHPRGGDPALHANRLEWARYPEGAIPPGTHRWTRRRAFLRLLPTVRAAAYDVTLLMGSPFPSPLSAPAVTVRSGSASQRFVLDRSLRPYALKVPAPAAAQPLLVQIDAPTWNRAGEPAEQGVRVDRMTVGPAR